MIPRIAIHIQSDNFDQGALYGQLAQGAQAGAVVTFVGRVREIYPNEADRAESPPMWLEHYPGMTEKTLQRIADSACERWPLLAVTMVHRVGELSAGEQIVFVGVSAAHRHCAFAACQYLMDFLKTEAPFWKREGTRWVEAKTSDEAAARRWNANA